MLTARGVTVERGPLRLSVAEFRVAAGELHVLCGRNGAGKSTWLETLAGLIEPLTGEIRCLEGPSRPPAVAFLPARAEDALLGARRALEVELTLALRGEPATRAEELGAEIDRLLDLPREGSDCRAERLYRVLYGLLATGARTLLLDEPTARVTPDARQWLYRSLGRLREAGYALVAATHDPELARRADVLWRAEAGRLVRDDLVSAVADGVLRAPQPGGLLPGIVSLRADLDGALRALVRP